MQAAVLPMKKFNDVFYVQLQHEDIEDRELSMRLDPKFGSFHLRTDDDNVTAQHTIPISGYVEHVPSVCKNGERVNTDDSHDVIGVVVRDLNRNSNGPPKF